MQGLLNQLYVHEKEYLDVKAKWEHHMNAEIMAVQTAKNFEVALEAAKGARPDQEIYHPLGKAFIIIEPTKLASDLESLMKESQETIKKNKEL